MKTAESFLKTSKHVSDPSTKKKIKTVMWPPTKQLTKIPIIKTFCDGSLRNMLYWVYDEAMALIVIKFEKGSFRLIEKKDLLEFGKEDIHTLAGHQIICEQEVLEPAAKEFTSMISDIINKSMWLGTMGRSDVLVIEKD